MQISVLEIKFGKSMCSVVGRDTTRRVVLRRRMTSDTILELAARLCIGAELSSAYSRFVSMPYNADLRQKAGAASHRNGSLADECCL
jgi:hypothetical protein